MQHRVLAQGPFSRTREISSSEQTPQHQAEPRSGIISTLGRYGTFVVVPRAGAVQSRSMETRCDLIRSEKRSGTTTAGRDELRTVLDFLRSGDVLMVTRLDRLARSIGDLQDIVRTGDRHENRAQSQKDDRFWLADPWRMADGSVY